MFLFMPTPLVRIGTVQTDWKLGFMKRQQVEEVAEKRYQTLAEVPGWGKATIKELLDKGGFADANKLDLTEDMIRTFVILDR